MSMTYNRQLPSPHELKEQYPLPAKLGLLKAQRDREIRQVFQGESEKFLVIVGPCSADREDTVLGSFWITGAARLRLKESDRLETTARALRALGACGAPLPLGDEEIQLRAAGRGRHPHPGRRARRGGDGPPHRDIRQRAADMHRAARAAGI